jgi:hypothetical protein
MSLFCLLLLIALSDSVKRVGDTKTPTALYRHHNKSRGWLCEPFPVSRYKCMGADGSRRKNGPAKAA